MGDPQQGACLQRRGSRQAPQRHSDPGSRALKAHRHTRLGLLGEDSPNRLQSVGVVGPQHPRTPSFGW